jgi:prepilin-type N-terminal cleavage/methylation domain-containing protein
MRRDDGFTLIEILATFVLIAIILPVAMNGISLAAKLANQAKRRVEAGTIAEKYLNDLVVSGDYEDGDQSGEASGDNTEYEWKFEVNDWSQEDSMQQLDLTVSWEGSGGWEKSVTLSTLVYTGSDE